MSLTRVTRAVGAPGLVGDSGAAFSTPEHGLLVAIIVRAMHDVMYTGDNYNLSADYIRRSAVGWLTSRREPSPPWSYVWCCDQLDIDPEIIEVRENPRFRVKKESHHPEFEDSSDSDSEELRYVVYCRGALLEARDQAGVRYARRQEILGEEDSQIGISHLVWLGDLLSETASIERASEQPLELKKPEGRGHEP